MYVNRLSGTHLTSVRRGHLSERKDIDNGTEVFRVPQHNNKEPMDVMHDFVAVSFTYNSFIVRLRNHFTSVLTLYYWYIIKVLLARR